MTNDPAVALRKLDRKTQYFEQDVMATGVADDRQRQSAVVMRALVGNAPAADDVAVLVLYRRYAAA